MKNMTDIDRRILEKYRPNESAIHCVNFVLEQLFKDKNHTLDDEVVKNCTYEELIGALLHARDNLNCQDEEDDDEEPCPCGECPFS